jgi:galactokinase
VIDPFEIARAFRARYGREPRIYHAPGRVNLIGEHTDYNDGFVMPIALDRRTWVAAAPRADRLVVAHSREYDETVTIDLDAAAAGPARHWSDYVRGVAVILDGADGDPERVALQQLDGRHDGDMADAGRPVQGRLGGAELLIASDVPVGAGLSSSAALEVACGYALADLNGLAVDLTDLARTAQRAEHQFAGTRCGIMDQMIACYGRQGAALMLDTRSLERRWVPLPPDLCVVIANTMVRHALASGEYNARRADCEAGVAILARLDSSIRALRDATLAQLDAARAGMPERVYRRCRHVISENTRVEAAARALGGGDLSRVGALMQASHASLRDDYEVSCAELDHLVEAFSSIDGVYGARMTGGGFGGCAVALVDLRAEANVRRDVARRYHVATGRQPDVWVTSAGGGAGAWSLDPAPAPA